VVRAHLAEAGVEAEVVKLDGAVEIAIELGVADVIADVVETGSTLRQMGLELIGSPILKSEAVLVRRRGAQSDPAVEQFLRRMQGVLVARSYVLMDYDIRAEHLKAAVAVTPGLESPTVSPLHTEGWVAVRAMVVREDAQRIMDDLWEIGARAILVTDIRACRL
jgi:ATP phosphoribosyltransferase